MYTMSIVVPILNEEKYISDFLKSIELQDFSKEKFEVLLIDGESTDKTIELIEKFKKNSRLNITIYNNPRKIQACAMNIGIKKCISQFIIRLDAHAYYPPNYLSSCLKLLMETGADNVGFCIKTCGRGFVGEIIAKVQSSKFGVGDSDFRINKIVQETDTVPFGAFRKDVFERIGLFNENLVCNEDNDINERIKESKGKIILSNLTTPIYYCRDNYKDFIRMARRNGKWNIITCYYSKKSMKLRHFIPFFFSSSILSLILLGFIHDFFFFILFVELLLYFLVDSIVSIKLSKNVKEFINLFCAFFIFHFSYGFGSILGCVDYFNLKLREDF